MQVKYKNAHYLRHFYIEYKNKSEYMKKQLPKVLGYVPLECETNELQATGIESWNRNTSTTKHKKTFL